MRLTPGGRLPEKKEKEKIGGLKENTPLLENTVAIKIAPYTSQPTQMVRVCLWSGISADLDPCLCDHDHALGRRFVLMPRPVQMFTQADPRKDLSRLVIISSLAGTGIIRIADIVVVVGVNVRANKRDAAIVWGAMCMAVRAGLRVC